MNILVVVQPRLICRRLIRISVIEHTCIIVLQGKYLIYHLLCYGPYISAISIVQCRNYNRENMVILWASR